MISIVINCDSRPGAEADQTTSDVMMNGTRSFDFMIDGVLNKLRFFRGHETEVILFVDRHLDIPLELYDKWNAIKNLTVCLSRHREHFGVNTYYPKWNDINYLQALYLARGEYIAHFDGDSSAFRSDGFDAPKSFIDLLNVFDGYKYISYPSKWSPAPDCNAGGEWDYWWASTRFFFCKRSTLNFTEIEKCLSDSGYLYGKYGDKNRKCPWLEHILGIIAGPGKVFYPPIELNKYAIFSWSNYRKGVLQDLNNREYNEVRDFINSRGGIQYPNDVSC